MLPHGTHKIALNVYSILFKNLRLGKDWVVHMPKFSIGLFPFFQYCLIQVKPDFLRLISDNFLIMGVEMIPMLTGLITALLPGFEEQDEVIQRKVSQMFDEIKNNVGTRFFIGSIWLSILRNPKVRQPGIKYLTKIHKKFDKTNESESTIDESRLREMNCEKLDQNYRDDCKFSIK